MEMRQGFSRGRGKIGRRRGHSFSRRMGDASWRVARGVQRVAQRRLERAIRNWSESPPPFEALLLPILALALEACGGGGSNGEPQPPVPPIPRTPAPTIDAPSEASVDENGTGNTIAPVSWTNATEVVVDDERFEIADGNLKLRPQSSLDYESDSSPLAVTVTATGEGGSTTATVSVTIRDLNEAPAIAVREASVPSGAAGARAAIVDIVDPDAADADLGVADISVSDGRFEVREDSDGTLHLALKQATSLDRDQAESVRLSLTVSDHASLTAMTEVLVSILGPNRAPAITVVDVFVPADRPGILLGLIQVDDPDAADANLGPGDISVDDNRFEARLDEEGTLRLALKQGIDLHYTEAGETIRVVLTVTDNQGATSSDTAILVVAATLPIGGAASGRIDSMDDRDWFAVTLEGGRSYRVDLEGRDTNRGTLPDPYISGIYDANGNLLAGTSDDDTGVGLNGRTVFVPDEDGTYYVSAAEAAEETGTYTLSVKEFRDDFGNSVSTSGVLSVDGSASGEIELAWDEDWFSVQLEAGHSYLIDVEGAATNAGELADPFLRGVFDEAGERIADTENFDGGVGTNARFVFVAREDGTHYLSASGEFAETGTYSLSIVEYLDDFSANSGTSGTVSIGGSVRGEIGAPGDQDWIQVALVAGKTYRIDIEGADTGRGSLKDPYLHGIYDSSGEYVEGTLDDDGGTGRDSRIGFTPAEDGLYYIGVGGALGEIGSYRVSVQEQAPGGASRVVAQSPGGFDSPLPQSALSSEVPSNKPTASDETAGVFGAATHSIQRDVPFIDYGPEPACDDVDFPPENNSPEWSSGFWPESTDPWLGM